MRRLVPWAATLLAVALLAPAALSPSLGAPASDPATGPVQLSPTPSTDVSGVETGPDGVPRVDGNWSTLVFEAHGPGGSWVYAYQPLPEPVDALSVDVASELAVEDAGPERTVAFAAGPMPTVDEGDGFHALAKALDPPILLGDGDLHRSIDRGFGLGVGAGQITGVGLAVGANAPWNVSVTVTLPDADGPTTRPSYEHTNTSGVRFYTDNRRILPGVDDGATRVTLSGTVPGPGWTNVQVLYDVFQPVGVRDDNVELSDGTAYDRRSFRYGQGIAGCSVGYGGSYSPIYHAVKDLYGTYTAKEGEFRATVLDVGGSTDIGLAAVHLPVARDALPEGHLTGGYAAERFPCHGTR